MKDVVEEYQKCDWCESSVKNIGPSVTGFMFHLYHTYLCNNPRCGHEMEFMQLEYDPDHYVEIYFPLVRTEFCAMCSKHKPQINKDSWEPHGICDDCYWSVD